MAWVSDASWDRNVKPSKSSDAGIVSSSVNTTFKSAGYQASHVGWETDVPVMGASLDSCAYLIHHASNHQQHQHASKKYAQSLEIIGQSSKNNGKTIRARLVIFVFLYCDFMGKIWLLLTFPRLRLVMFSQESCVTARELANVFRIDFGSALLAHWTWAFSVTFPEGDARICGDHLWRPGVLDP